MRAPRSCLSFNLFLSSHFQSLEYTSECWKASRGESRREKIESVDTFPVADRKGRRSDISRGYVLYSCKGLFIKMINDIFTPKDSKKDVRRSYSVKHKHEFRLFRDAEYTNSVFF